ITTTDGLLPRATDLPRSVAGTPRSDRLGRHTLPSPVRWTAATPVPGLSRARLARAALPRRTDRWTRPPGTDGHVGSGRSTARGRGRGYPLHLPHGGGRTVGRPRGHHRPRHRGRLRHTRRTHRWAT